MSNETIELPNSPMAPVDVIPSAVPADVRVANTGTLASAVTAISGLSGGGKSSLADTGAEYCAEEFGKITLCYAIDPGGFGTKRLALIRAGVMKVWDPRNHVNYFETMELISLGAWPETIEDPERGYADPNVKLILPRRLVADLYCPAGHVAKRFDSEIELNIVSNAGGVPCQQCGVLTTLQNAQKVEKLIVRHRMFRDVGLRIYDSITAMNDAGLIIELPTMSANNKFAKGKEGGSALGSADAFRQGTVAYGTGSEAQVGFMQNRTYGWLMNIRALPDVVVPTICTFGIEESKKDDESGGLQVLGMRIAGKARTSASAGWVGHLLYASHEPEDLPRGTAQSPNMVYRLWLTTHTDPRDARRMPILAKHRGTPLGVDYLEDPFEADANKRKANAWSRCSLGVFFRMLDAQTVAETETLRKRFPQFADRDEEEAAGPVDEVMGVAGGRMAIASNPLATTGGMPSQAAAGAPAPQAAGLPRMPRRRGGVAAPAVPVAPPPMAVVSVASQPAPAVVTQEKGTQEGGPNPPAVPVVGAVTSTAASAPLVQPAASPTTPESPSVVMPVQAAEPSVQAATSVVQQQLEASVKDIEAKKAAVVTQPVAAQSVPQIASAPAQSTVSTPAPSGLTPPPPAIPPSAPAAVPSQAAAAAVGSPRVVRRPKPPIQ